MSTIQTWRDQSPLAADILEGKYDDQIDLIQQACQARLKQQFRKGVHVEVIGGQLMGKTGVGWWGQNTDGTSFAGEDLVWGDGPADIIDNALDKITEEFQANWERDPWREEVLAGVNFSARVRFKSLEEVTLVAEFDVSQLSDAERDQLSLELAAQAERSDAHPSVPAPKITVERGGTSG